MAHIDRLRPNTTVIGSDQNHPTMMNLLNVVAGGKTGVFSGLAIDVCTAEGAITTWYYWPNSSGLLRYGSTIPTIDTQDTAGAVVNS